VTEPEIDQPDDEATDDRDESVPNGEEDIDAAGRNATQQRMVERGEPPVE
jgi:hypothetical protein